MGLGSYRIKIIICCGLIPLLIWHITRQWSSGSQKEKLIYGESQLQKVHVGVYYEALCPDSRSFIVKQLLPTYEKISENLKVDLIPYGKATTTQTPSGGYSFDCQHGPPECLANIIHACAIDAIEDLSLRLRYISCMIKNNLKPVEIAESCAHECNVNQEPILSCMESEKGKLLLANYGLLTHNLQPPIIFIPTITLNESSDRQPAILKNLLKEVCLLLKVKPAGCS